METLSPVIADDSSGANPSSVKSDDNSPQHESGRGSPPPNCAICLGTCKNKSFTDSCLHQFCFKCLLTWSKVKAECPLCKQNFKSIIHNVRSNHQYEEYMVVQRETEEPLDVDNPLAQASRRFSYRTTLTMPRRDSLAIQQLLLQFPGLLPGARTGPGLGLAARAGPGLGLGMPARRRRSPASFRRTVYRHRLWARPLPDFTGRFRDCWPEFYRYNDTQMHRLVPWLNRELHYLLNENIGHISYVITRILELLPQYHINSPEFREAVRPYFRDRTEHFLHELYCFASTPYDMTGYDRNVQYTTDTGISTMINEVSISSSESDASADSDIVMVSSSEPAEPAPGTSRAAGPSRSAGASRVPQPVYPQNYISEPAANNSVIPIEMISHSDTDDDSSEVLVVGYIKPPQDRTPEVVDLLGSDSDVIVQDLPPEPLGAAATPSEGSTPRVKLTLKRRRQRSGGAAAASTSDTSRSTPSPPHAAADDYAPSQSADSSSSTIFFTSTSSSSSSSSTSSDSFSDTSGVSSSSGGRRRVHKRKSRKKTRKATEVTEKKKCKKSSSKKPPSRPRKKEKTSKRKLHSGRAVKSSKKNESKRTKLADAQPERAPSALDQPSTSGTSSSHKHSSSKDKKRRRTSRESRRLKSVVNVMYNNRKTEESCSSVTSNVTSSAVTNPSTPELGLPDMGPRAVPVEKDHENSDLGEDSDWEDDLPLNLTVQKKSFHLL